MKHIFWSVILILLCAGCQKMEPKPGVASVDSTASLGMQDPIPIFVDATVSLGDQDPIPLSVTNLTYDHLERRYFSAYKDITKNIGVYAPEYPFAGTACDAFSGQRPSVRAKETYFYNFSFKDSGIERFDLHEEEIQVLRKMASEGDRIAGARLSLYYTCIRPDLKLAEEAIELAPIGNGINQYYISDFVFKLPDGRLAGSREFSSINSRFYLQKKQVLRLTYLSALGSRPAAARLSEYFLWGVCNEDLTMLFWKFARGDDSALPEIKELDARFKRGDQELIRKSFPTPLDKILHRRPKPLFAYNIIA